MKTYGNIEMDMEDKRKWLVCNRLVTVAITPTPPMDNNKKSYAWNVQHQGFIFIVREDSTMGCEKKSVCFICVTSTKTLATHRHTHIQLSK